MAATTFDAVADQCSASDVGIERDQKEIDASAEMSGSISGALLLDWLLLLSDRSLQYKLHQLRQYRTTMAWHGVRMVALKLWRMDEDKHKHRLG